MANVMEMILKVIKILGRVMSCISVIALLVMVFITVADIFLKQIFAAPVPGAIEITRMMMVCMTPTFISALVEKRHVCVGIFIDKLGRGGQLIFDTFGYLASAVLCALMCYQGFIDMSKKMTQRQVYSMLRIPTWPFYLIFAIAMGLFAVSILIYLIDIYLNKDRYAAKNSSDVKNRSEAV